MRIYQTAKEYLGGKAARVGAAIVITFAPTALARADNKAPPPKKGGIEYVIDGVGNYLEEADKCPPLDDFFWKGDIEGMAGYTFLLPGSIVGGYAKPVGGAIFDAPKKAMELADAQRKSEKHLLKKAYKNKEEKGLAAVLGFLLRGAYNLTGDAIEFGRDITCFTEKYSAVIIGGAIDYGAKAVKHALKNPIDAGVKGTASAAGIRWLSDAAHRTEHHIGGGEEQAPNPPFGPDGGTPAPPF